MDAFVPVARRADLKETTGHVVELKGRLIALFLVDGAVHAMDDACPHMGASLGAGYVEGGIVICPWHSWRFRVTDGANTLPVTYAGILPDLFREGQGVVALGTMGPDGTFRASEVLARHDETYMPPEVADALKRAGHWNPAEGGAPPAASWNRLDAGRQKDGG